MSYMNQAGVHPVFRQLDFTRYLFLISTSELVASISIIDNNEKGVVRGSNIILK